MFGVKKQDFGGNIFLLSILWVYTLFRQTFGLTSGASVRGKVGLILVKIIFNCFKFYINYNYNESDKDH